MSFQDLFLLKCVDSKTFPRKSKNFEAHRRALTHADIVGLRTRPSRVFRLENGKSPAGPSS